MTGLRKRIVEIPEHEYVDLMITFVYRAKGGERSTATERGFYVASDNVFVIKPRIDAAVVTD